MLEVLIGAFGDVTVMDADRGRRAIYADYPEDFPRSARVSPSITATTFANLMERDDLSGDWVVVAGMDGNRKAIANQAWKYVADSG